MSFAGADASATQGLDAPNGNTPDFGFNPDVSAVPPDYSAVRRTIMEDPNLKLDFHWNEAKAQQQAKQIDTSRYTDSAVLPLIKQDMERNQQHIDYMRAEMDKFQQTLDHPYPIRKMASFDTADTIGLLASGLLGGNIGNQAGAALAGNQADLNNSYQNEVNQFGLDQQRGQQIVAAAQAELNHSLGYQQQLEGQQVSEVSHQADLKHADLQKATQQFQTASNPGEVDYAVQNIVAAGGAAPSPEAIAEAKKAANIRYDHEQRMTAAQAYGQLDNEIRMYGGASTPEQQAAWQSQADKIAAMTGIPHAAIPGGPTWQAQQDKAANDFKIKNLEAEKAHWAGMLHTQNQHLIDQVAQWSAERTFRAQQAALSRDSATQNALIRANANGMAGMTRSRDLVAAEIDSKKKRLADIQQQLATISKNTSLSYSDKKAQTKALYAQQSSLTKAIGDRTDDLNKYNQVLGAMQQANQVDSGQQSQPQSQPQQQPQSGGQARMYQGHKYQQDASGQWHLIQ